MVYDGKLQKSGKKVDDLGVPLFLETPICPSGVEATAVADHFHEMETPLKPAIQLPKKMVHYVFRARTKKHTHSLKLTASLPQQNDGKRSFLGFGLLLGANC